MSVGMLKSNQILKRIVAFLIIVGIMSSIMLVNASGGWTKLYNENGTFGASSIGSGETRAQRFSGANFNSLRVFCPSYGNNVGNLTLTLYNWNTNYNTTVAGTPVATRTFIDFPDNSWLQLDFITRSSGEYLWVLNGATETVGVWTYTASNHPSTSYYNGSTSGVENFDYVSEIYNTSSAPGIANRPVVGKTISNTYLTGVTYDFYSEATNSSGNDVCFLFDWGDGTQTFSGYTKPTKGGRASHAWYAPGTYQVKARTYDVNGAPSSGWSEVATITLTGSSITPPMLNPTSIAASSEFNSSMNAAKVNDGDTGTFWSSKVSTVNSFGPEWIQFDLGSIRTIHRMKVTPRSGGQGFPLGLRLQYSNDNNRWFDLPVNVHNHRPNPGSTPQMIEAGGIAARYLRLYSDRIGKDSSNNYVFQLAEVDIYGEDGTLFFTSAGGQNDAAWSNLWTVYGIANNEITNEGISEKSRWFNGPGGILGIPSTEWQYWNALKLAWTDENALKNDYNYLINELKIGADGYVWASAHEEKHLGVSRHYTTNPMYVLSICHYYMWTRDTVFMNNILTKTRTAMDYCLETLNGKNGLMIITDPDVNGTPTAKPSNYWDNYPMGYKSAYENILMYAAVRAMGDMEQSMGNTSKAALYRSYLPTIRSTFNQTFWDSTKKRYIATIDVNNVSRDYGLTFLNMMAVMYGLADANQARDIYNWLDGQRTISGDTSTGSDIYFWKWAARANTRSIESISPHWWYSYNGQINVGANGNAYYGGHIENGGAIFYTSYDDVMSRIAGDGADNAYQRMLAIFDEFKIDELRRDRPNNKGMDWMEGIIGEYPESGLVALTMPYGFLGLSAKPNGLQIAPKIPNSLTFMGIKKIVYNGNTYRITGSKSITTATITNQGTYFDVVVPNGQEVIISGSSIISTNKTLPRTWAVASSTFNDSLNARNVMDNDNTTFWSSTQQASQSTSQTIHVDMGATYKVGRIKLTPRSSGFGFPVDFKFQYSINGSTWIDISGQSYTNYPNPGSSERTFTLATAVDARYIRLSASKIGTDNFNNFYLQMAEMRIETP